jgi:cell filamentation protein
MYRDSLDETYCYQGTNVLRNKLSITNQTELEIAENTLVGSKMLSHLPTGNLDIAHFKALHKHLFGAIYDWAGDFRTIRISKDNSHFCYPENIQSELERLFDNSRLLQSPSLNFDDLVIQGATFLSELNAIHPFREGNGRTQMVFLQMILDSFGIIVDYSKSNKSDIINAIVHGFKHDNSLLEIELRKIISGV